MAWLMQQHWSRIFFLYRLPQKEKTDENAYHGHCISPGLTVNQRRLYTRPVDIVRSTLEYKGYLILGRAQVIHPGSPDWRSQVIICTNTPEGSIMIKRLDGAVYHSLRAAEEHGLALGKQWIDENPKQGVA